MPNQTIDLRNDSQYNLIINKDRTLNAVITAQIVSGTTTGNTIVDFDFSSFSAATMQVRIKPDAPFVVLEFQTSDGSIVLSTGSTFQLIKTATELAKVRSGEYFYDMYLSNVTYPKYAFLSGVFTITSNITT
jgi:hypothetical protein